MNARYEPRLFRIDLRDLQRGPVGRTCPTCGVAPLGGARAPSTASDYAKRAQDEKREMLRGGWEYADPTSEETARFEKVVAGEGGWHDLVYIIPLRRPL
jgi:hypothetical protein